MAGDISEPKVVHAQNLDNDGVEQLQNRPDIQALDLMNNYRLNDRALQSAAAMPNLKELILDESTQTQNGYAALKDSSIEAVQRRYGTLSSDADKAAATFGEMKSLKDLDLEHTPMTDAGLAKIAENGNIENLDLNGAKNLTPESINILSKMTNLKHLDMIDAANLRHSDTEKLKELMPNCEVNAGTWDPYTTAGNLTPNETPQAKQVMRDISMLDGNQGYDVVGPSKDALDVLSHMPREQLNNTAKMMEGLDGYTVKRDANGDVKQISYTNNEVIQGFHAAIPKTPAELADWAMAAAGVFTGDALKAGYRKIMRGSLPDVEINFEDGKVSLQANDYFDINSNDTILNVRGSNKISAPYTPLKTGTSG